MDSSVESVYTGAAKAGAFLFRDPVAASTIRNPQVHTGPTGAGNRTASRSHIFDAEAEPRMRIRFSVVYDVRGGRGELLPPR